MAVDLRRLRNRKALIERAAEAGMRKSRARARLHGVRRLRVMQEGRRDDRDEVVIVANTRSLHGLICWFLGLPRAATKDVE